MHQGLMGKDATSLQPFSALYARKVHSAPMEIPCSGCVSRNTPATPKKITLFSALLNLVVSSTAGWMDLVQSSSEAYYENFQKSKL
jgi:hypothetical protein